MSDRLPVVPAGPAAGQGPGAAGATSVERPSAIPTIGAQHEAYEGAVMSVLLVSYGAIDCLAAAAVDHGVADDARAVAALLLGANQDSFLVRNFDDAHALDDWDDLEDDERDEELGEVVEWRDGYTFADAPAEAREPSVVLDALGYWSYQVMPCTRRAEDAVRLMAALRTRLAAAGPAAG